MNPSKLFELFDKAQRNLKFPKLTIYTLNPTPYDPKIRLTMGNTPDAIWVSNGLSRGDPFNKLYGKFSRTNFTAYRNDSFDIIPILKELCEDPLKFGKIHGTRFGYCCFCNTELTSKESLFVGYGPICAETWGLPWG